MNPAKRTPKKEDFQITVVGLKRKPQDNRPVTATSAVYNVETMHKTHGVQWRHADVESDPFFIMPSLSKMNSSASLLSSTASLSLRRPDTVAGGERLPSGYGRRKILTPNTVVVGKIRKTAAMSNTDSGESDKMILDEPEIQTYFATVPLPPEFDTGRRLSAIDYFERLRSAVSSRGGKKHVKIQECVEDEGDDLFPADVSSRRPSTQASSRARSRGGRPGTSRVKSAKIPIIDEAQSEEAEEAAQQILDIISTLSSANSLHELTENPEAVINTLITAITGSGSIASIVSATPIEESAPPRPASEPQDTPVVRPVSSQERPQSRQSRAIRELITAVTNATGSKDQLNISERPPSRALLELLTNIAASASQSLNSGDEISDEQHVARPPSAKLIEIISKIVNPSDSGMNSAESLEDKEDGLGNLEEETFLANGEISGENTEVPVKPSSAASHVRPNSAKQLVEILSHISSAAQSRPTTAGGRPSSAAKIVEFISKISASDEVREEVRELVRPFSAKDNVDDSQSSSFDSVGTSSESLGQSSKSSLSSDKASKKQWIPSGNEKDGKKKFLSPKDGSEEGSLNSVTKTKTKKTSKSNISKEKGSDSKKGSSKKLAGDKAEKASSKKSSSETIEKGKKDFFAITNATNSQTNLRAGVSTVDPSATAITIESQAGAVSESGKASKLGSSAKLLEGSQKDATGTALAASTGDTKTTTDGTGLDKTGDIKDAKKAAKKPFKPKYEPISAIAVYHANYPKPDRKDHDKKEDVKFTLQIFDKCTDNVMDNGLAYRFWLFYVHLKDSGDALPKDTRKELSVLYYDDGKMPDIVAKELNLLSRVEYCRQKVSWNFIRFLTMQSKKENIAKNVAEIFASVLIGVIPMDDDYEPEERQLQSFEEMNKILQSDQEGPLQLSEAVAYEIMQSYGKTIFVNAVAQVATDPQDAKLVSKKWLVPKI